MICLKNWTIFKNVWKISQITNKSYKNIRYLDVSLYKFSIVVKPLKASSKATSILIT